MNSFGGIGGDVVREKVRLGDVATVITKGTTPTSIGYDFVDKGINFVKIESISENGDFIEEKFAHITNKCNEKLKRSQLQENDILFSIAGAIGRVAIVDKKILPANTNQALAIIRLPGGLFEYSFLKYILTSPVIEQQFEKQKQGVAQVNISLKNISDFELPVLGIDEQRKISCELDNLSNLISKRKLQLSKLDELVKARFVEMFGDPVDNSMGWATKQLQELVTDDCTISYGIVQTGDDQEDGIPVLRPVDIVNHTPIRSELKKTTEEISNKYKRTILKGREMLITVRANIADTCIVGEEFIGCNVGRGVVPIRTREDEMILEFLKYQIDSKHLNDNIKALAKGITLIQLNMEDLREITLIVPAIEKQKSFVEFAKQTDKSKSEIQKSLEKLEILKKALMQKYFG